MNLRHIFRRTRPIPALTESEKAAISADYRARVHEIKIMSAWGLTEKQWNALTAQARADKRTNYTKAPRYIK